MNVDDIYGTLYSPTDGTIDPTGMCEALTRSAKKAGSKVIGNFIYFILFLFVWRLWRLKSLAKIPGGMIWIKENE